MTFELKQIDRGQEPPAVTVLMEANDPDYLECRALNLKNNESDPDTEYRVIARF